MTNNVTFSSVVIIIASAGFSAAVSAQSVMQPGGWDMRVKITAQDPATGESKNVNESTAKFCLTRDFLDKEPYLTPGIDRTKMEQKGAKCSISDEKRIANSASWIMACTMADGSMVEMLINNAASAHELQSDVQQIVNKNGGSIKIRMAIKSSYIGDCTKEMLKP